MKLRVTLIDWEYPASGKPPAPELLDLGVAGDVMQLYMGLANGTLVEMKAEGQCEETLAVLRGMVRGAGRASRRDPTAEERAGLWLYEDGLESYRQSPGDPPNIFIDPVPRPERF